jgi:hypothetical protein
VSFRGVADAGTTTTFATGTTATHLNTRSMSSSSSISHARQAAPGNFSDGIASAHVGCV